MSRSVEDKDIEAIADLVEEIGISGVLIAANQACEGIARQFQHEGNRDVADNWWDNAGACQVASEQVNDTGV